jgi:hypothetical protein
MQKAMEDCVQQQAGSTVNLVEDENFSITAMQIHSNETSIRGESLCRYRFSGTPIYDHDVSSLRSFDDQREPSRHHLVGANATPLLRPDSAFTGNSRYFSAKSTSLGTRVMSNRFDSGQEQERAVANGALRFRGRSSGQATDTLVHSPIIPPCSTPNDENDFPMTPVTVTQASRVYCRHRVKQMQLDQMRRTNQIGLDGTSTSPEGHSPTAQSSHQDEDHVQNNEPAILHSQPSTDSFRRRNHISRHVRGVTWRTRMRKTKCWRCELESRRKASGKLLYHGCGKVIHGWHERWRNMKDTLRWTCFCCYRGYDDDSEENLAEVQERARLGRFGGSLSQQRRY